MHKKPQPNPVYQRLVTAHTPKKKVFRNALVAFCSGGLLCALAETARLLLVELGGLTDDVATARVLVVVVALAALLTGCGVYDKLGQKLGAGLAVPITGFANSVAAAMLEHKYEGLVLGSGCNSFKLAGAVIVFGIAAAAILGTLALLFGAV